jgi:hypothetical protein
LPLEPARDRFAITMSTALRLCLLALGLALAAAPVFAGDPPKTALANDPLSELSKGKVAGSDTKTKQAVAALLRGNTAKYGEDAAALQGLLLVHTIEGQAVLEAHSEILGFEDAEGRRWIAYRVASGVVLNDRELDRERRLERIWHIVVEKTLQRYPSFQVPVDGIAVEVNYNHRPFRSVADLYANIDDTGPIERAKFYLPSADVSQFVDKKLAPQQLLDRSRVLLDNQPVNLVLTEKPAAAAPPAKPEK